MQKGDAPKEGITTVLASADTVVLDDDLNPLEPGTGVVGRLARGGNIPLGYYNDPEKTAATFVADAQGRRWSIPGDYALLEADGRITLLGRGSVSINSGGEKIYPEEVEGALKSHPDVFDVLVVGVPDDRWGERVAALLQPREGRAPTLDELQEHCRTQIAGYKVPRQLLLVDEVPRLPNGKPDYRRAKERAERARPAAELDGQGADLARPGAAPLTGRRDRLEAGACRRPMVTGRGDLPMSRRPIRPLLVFATVLAVACSSLAAAFAAAVARAASPAAASVTTHTPVMGPNLLSARAARALVQPRCTRRRRRCRRSATTSPRSRRSSSTKVAREGVRGDIAFVQSMLETGWFAYTELADPARRQQLRGHVRLRRPQGPEELQARRPRPSRCFPSAVIGVRTQIQLLRGYADATTRAMSGRLRSRRRTASASRRSGSTSAAAMPCGKLIWASAKDYGIDILQARTPRRSCSTACNAACLPYSPGNNAHNSGNGYWVATDESHVYTFGDAHYYGDMASRHLNSH